jgi:hypothetical protein
VPEPEAAAFEGAPTELVDDPPAATGDWPVPPADGCAAVPDESLLLPEPEAGPTEVDEWVTLVTVDDAVLVDEEAVEPADWAAELAVETTEELAELAVDTADCTVEETALVALEVETGGDGTETAGPDAEALTDGVETDGSPEARLADAPDPTMAAGASVSKQTRISDFDRFIKWLSVGLTRPRAKTFADQAQGESAFSAPPAGG